MKQNKLIKKLVSLTLVICFIFESSATAISPVFTYFDSIDFEVVKLPDEIAPDIIYSNTQHRTSKKTRSLQELLQLGIASF